MVRIDLLPPMKTEEGRALNRRVIFNIQHVKYSPYVPTAVPSRAPAAPRPAPTYVPPQPMSYPEPQSAPDSGGGEADDAVSLRL